MQVERYGHTKTLRLAEVGAVRCGAFGNTLGRLILAVEPDSDKPYGLALFTTGTTTSAAQIIARFDVRWTTETAIANGKQTLVMGQARTRLPHAGERTVPFAFCVQSLVILWYATTGRHPQDLDARLAAEPWYIHNSDPAFESMLAKLSRTNIAVRFTPTDSQQRAPDIILDYTLACVAAAA